jgi:hypothetical protein
MPFLQSEVLHRLANVDAGVVHQDVEAAPARRRLVDHAPDGVLIGDVDGNGVSLRSAALEIVDGRARFLLVAAGHDDAGARHCQAARHAQADAAIAARDDRHLPLQIKHGPLQLM